MKDDRKRPGQSDGWRRDRRFRTGDSDGKEWGAGMGRMNSG